METARNGVVTPLADAPRRPGLNGNVSLEGRWLMRGVDGRAISRALARLTPLNPSTGHHSTPLMHSSESALNANPNEP